MGKVLVIIFSIITLLAISSTGTIAEAAKNRPKKRVLEQKTSTELGDKADSAILIEASTGLVLYEKDPNKQWPPASMTKMMTMLIAAEKLSSGAIKKTDMVKVSSHASKMGGSQVWLKEGEEFTFEELMRTVVVGSANDSSAAIAEAISGSVHDFIDLMNERASQIGMENTLFNSVHGLPPGPGQEGDITTAADMAKLAQELVKHPEILAWSSLVTDEFRGGKLIIHNINKLIGSYEGADGLKTGHIKESGFNLTGTAKRGDLRLIVVIMGAQTNQERFSQAAKLLNYGFSNYTKALVAKADSPIGPAIKVNHSKIKSITATPSSDLSLVLKKAEARAIKQEFQLPESIDAPVKKGQELGLLILKSSGKEVGKVTLLSPQDIPKAGFFWRLFH